MLLEFELFLLDPSNGHICLADRDGKYYGLKSEISLVYIF